MSETRTRSGCDPGDKGHDGRYTGWRSGATERAGGCGERVRLEDRKKRHAWWKWWKWLVAGIALAAVTFTLVSWMLFQHVPAWYQPVQVPPERVQAVRNDLARVQDQLGERIVNANQPFEIRITQDQINAWIAAREEMWPLSREWLPPEIAEPFVVIQPEGVRLAATFDNGSIQTVLSVLLEIGADEQALHVRVADVRSGSLPVPLGWLEDLLRRAGVEQKLTASFGGQGNRKFNLKSIFEGAWLPNEGVWWEPERPYRVIGLDLEPGSLTLTIRPLPYRHSRR